MPLKVDYYQSLRCFPCVRSHRCHPELLDTFADKWVQADSDHQQGVEQLACCCHHAQQSSYLSFMRNLVAYQLNGMTADTANYSFGHTRLLINNIFDVVRSDLCFNLVDTFCLSSA